MSLEKTYFQIKTKFENKLKIEPFSVVKSVNEHRNFWKPKRVRILLMAESHVYTPIEEYNHTLQYSAFPELYGCPPNYVKLVYCLGYGEREFSRVNSKSGTPDYWKIFTSCVHQNYNSEFSKILLTETKNQNQRLQNKISLLEKLKKEEIWLVDASIVAVNKTVKLTEKIRREILNISWKHYISKVIRETQPKKIIVIGRRVSKTLKDELDKINIPYEKQNQPQGIRTKEGFKKSFEKYYQYCNSE